MPLWILIFEYIHLDKENKEIQQENWFFGKSSTVRRLKRSHMTAINQVVHRPDREKGPSLPKISDGQVFENSWLKNSDL